MGDDATPMTIEQCDCRRRTTRRWVGGISVVTLTVFAVYVVPAISAGYRAQNAINNHLVVQEEFEKRMDLRFDSLEAKFKTSWGHAGDAREAAAAARKAAEALADDIRRLQDLVIAGGARALPDSTE